MQASETIGSPGSHVLDRGDHRHVEPPGRQSVGQNGLDNRSQFPTADRVSWERDQQGLGVKIRHRTHANVAKPLGFRRFGIIDDLTDVGYPGERSIIGGNSGLCQVAILHLKKNTAVVFVFADPVRPGDWLIFSALRELETVPFSPWKDPIFGGFAAKIGTVPVNGYPTIVTVGTFAIFARVAARRVRKKLELERPPCCLR